MNIYCAGLTDVGKVRKNNEDAFLIEPNLKLFAVCDGMGGHQSGEIASSNMIEFIKESIKDNYTFFQDFIKREISAREVSEVLLNIIKEANFKLYEMANSENSLKGMGTTLVMLLILRNKAFLVHVGDSRLYLFREGRGYILTDDHSIGHEISNSSLPSRYRNALTRALGVSEFVEPDVLSFDLFPGDVLLLTTDGLHSYFSTRKFLKFIESTDKKDANTQLKKMFDYALSKGGADNLTAIYLYIEDDPEAEEYKFARKKLKVIQNLNIFRYLTFPEILQIMNLTYGEFFTKGTKIFSEDEVGETLYIIIKGRVKITKHDFLVSEFSDGQHFGEMALIERAPRSATATAVEDTLCLCIKKDDFYQLLKGNLEISVKILWSFTKALSRRLRDTTEELIELRKLFIEKNRETIETIEIGDEEFEISEEIEPPPIPNDDNEE